MRRLLVSILLCLLPACMHTSLRPPSGGPDPDSPDKALAWRRLTLASADGSVRRGGLQEAIVARQQNVRFWRDQVRTESAGISPVQWVSRGPQNVGGRTRSLVIHPTNPSVMWAGSVSGGVWKTVDGGQNWYPTDDFMLNLAVGALALDPANPDVLFAGTGEGQFNGDAVRGAGIFKSTDAGETWTRIPGTDVWDSVNRIAIAPTNSNLMLAATRYGGIQRSTDGGATWSNVRWAQGSFFVAFHPTDPTRAVASVLDYDSDWFYQALYSTDGGATWNVSSGGLNKVYGFSSRIELAYAPSQPTTVYAVCGAVGGRCWRSLDGGASYTARSAQGVLGTSWYTSPIWVSPTNPIHVVSGSYDLYRSTNAGATFTQISAGYIMTSEAHPDQHLVVSHPGYNGTTNRTVFATNDGGVFRMSDVLSTQPSQAWTSLNQTYQTTQFYGAAGDGPTGLVSGGTQDNGTLTTPLGNQDATLTFGGDGGFAAIDRLDPSYVYNEYVRLQLVRSSDGGGSANWIYDGISDAGIDANFIAPFVLDPNDPRILLGGGRSLWRTFDARQPTPAWSAIRGPGSDLISAIAVAPSDSNLIWIAQNDGQVWKTSNGLDASPTWSAVDDNAAHDPLPNRYPTRILIDPDDAQRVLVAFGGYEDGNLRSTTDGGSTWADLTGSGATGLPLAPIRGIARHPCNAQWLYVGTEVGLFTSEDRGLTWSAANQGPANVSVDEVVFMHGSTTLLAATHGRGMWTAETDALDSDADGLGNVCDADDDNDGLADADDCSPLDPAAGTPDEAGPLQLAGKSPTTLDWLDVPRADVYDVSRGLLSSLASGYGACLARHIPLSQVSDDPPPVVGQGYFYLVRGVDEACGGPGSWGRTSAGAERLNPACD